MPEDSDLSQIRINLSGDFELSDGRIGNVVSTPELSELNAFLGVLKGAVTPSNAFEEMFSRIGKKFRKQKGAVLEIRTSQEGKELTHKFFLSNAGTLTYEEADELLTQAGWSLDSWHPLEISSVGNPGSKASGVAARLLLEHLQQTL